MRILFYPVPQNGQDKPVKGSAAPLCVWKQLGFEFIRISQCKGANHIFIPPKVNSLILTWIVSYEFTEVNMNLDFFIEVSYDISDFKKTSERGEVSMATDKRQFTLRVQDDTYEKIRYIAFVERRSVAKAIEHAMLEYIVRFEQRNGVIQIPQCEDPSESGQ